MAKHTLAAVDLAKAVFELAVSPTLGRSLARRGTPASSSRPLWAQLPPAVVVMEACGSAHYWVRYARTLAHTPVLLPSQAVGPYVRRKADRTPLGAHHAIPAAW